MSRRVSRLAARGSHLDHREVGAARLDCRERVLGHRVWQLARQSVTEDTHLGGGISRTDPLALGLIILAVIIKVHHDRPHPDGEFSSYYPGWATRSVSGSSDSGSSSD